jgi:hypothetical protein
MSIRVDNSIQIDAPVPIDNRLQFTTVAAALAGIALARRFDGLRVWIVAEQCEYYFHDDLSNANFTPYLDSRVVEQVNLANCYVDASAGNDANDGLTAATAWQTLAKISSVFTNKHLNSDVHIHLIGTFNENLSISNISGAGIIWLEGISNAFRANINGQLELDYIVPEINIRYLNITTVADSALLVSHVCCLLASSCNFTYNGSIVGKYAIELNRSVFTLTNIAVNTSNAGITAIMLANSTGQLTTVTGTVAGTLIANTNSIISYGGVTATYGILETRTNILGQTYPNGAASQLQGIDASSKQTLFGIEHTESESLSSAKIPTVGKINELISTGINSIEAALPVEYNLTAQVDGTNTTFIVPVDITQANNYIEVFWAQLKQTNDVNYTIDWDNNAIQLTFTPNPGESRQLTVTVYAGSSQSAPPEPPHENLPPLPPELQPTVTIGQDQTVDAATTEAGTTFDMTFTPNYTPNGEGAITEFKIQSSQYDITTDTWGEWEDIATESYLPSSLTVNDVQVGDKTKIRAVTTYAPGTEYDGGTVYSDEIELSTSRCLYWGLSTAAPTTSDIVRSLPNVIFNPQEGTQWAIPPMDMPADTYLSIWYPAILRDINSIFQYAGAIPFMDIKSAFVKDSVVVEGANGFEGIEYKGYYYHVEIAWEVEEDNSFLCTL